MPPPLTYAERAALATGQPPDPQARAKATALVQKITKGDAMPDLTFEELVAQNRDLGFNADTAFTMAAKQDPEGYRRWQRAAADAPPPLVRPAPAPDVAKTTAEVLHEAGQQVRTTDPAGVAKSADGTLKSWDEQTAYWRQHPEAYAAYRWHFATSGRRG